MKFKNAEWNLVVIVLAMIAFATILGLLLQNFEEDSKSTTPDLLVYVDAPHFHLFAREISSFDKTLRKHSWLKVQPLPESEAIEQFQKHPESMLVLNRKLSQDDLILDEKRLPLQYETIATDKNQNPAISLYLIHDQEVHELERKFATFVKNAQGKKIIQEEGLEPNE